ncbi:MAG: M23 family metallopeptidase [Rhodospirillaceae bacterium]|jgi:murein DD-endopeptidase MepM/ murein hydrolase activator NlpD|nr:M23 family metallopeptidase [Rhodospirillaceae bacterium]
MKVGLHPNAVWYTGSGALLGAVLAISSQISSQPGSGINISSATADSALIETLSPSEALGLSPIIISAGPTPVLEKTELTVGRGDTLLGLLQKNNIAASEAHAAVSALSEIYDPRDIRVGQKIVVSATADAAAPDLDAIRIAVGPGHDVMALRSATKTFSATTLKAQTSLETQAFTGIINSSLYEAAVDRGVPAPVLVEMIRLFSYDVDFQRDIRSNDSFEIMFERRVTEDGLVVANGEIEYASMTLRGKSYKIYAFEHSEDHIDYYNEDGKGIRKALMRTPINGARLSSSFGRRKHPVLGYTKMHRGVDFAAPRGTPIYAAGDGVIEKRQRWSSFGNYMRIRHGDGFATAYAHMKSFAKGYSVGSRVKQGVVIGYVGTTGRSTGPHLHYEVHKNGGQVNPMKVRFPASKSLSGDELNAFQAVRRDTDVAWTRIFTERDVASLDGDSETRSVE